MSLSDVADIIMVEFCKEMGGLEEGSPYIEKAYRNARLNIYSPTVEQMEMAIINLEEIEKELFNEKKASENKKARLKLLMDV